jgi:hypothetical protein
VNEVERATPSGLRRRRRLHSLQKVGCPGFVFTLTTAAGQEQFLSLTTCLRLAAEGVNRGGQVGVSMDWERPPCSENEGPLLTG